MCGRYTFTLPSDFAARFGIENMEPDLEPRYNVAPGQILPVVVSNSPNRVELMRWGLVPSWAKDPKIGNRMINARAETVATKPAFRRPFVARRCLVPATGFFEWQKQGSRKTPFYIRLKDQSLFAFAGLYDVWRDREGQELKTYTIITTTANGVVAPIHDRMPVILKQADEATWLDPGLRDQAALQRLLAPYDAEQMEFFPVSTRVNDPRHESADVLQPDG
jgi:putative SOS response-associated peptidase YedK